MRLSEPTLQGPFTGQPVLGMAPVQEDPDQPRAPGGMLHAEVEPLLHQRRRLQQRRSPTGTIVKGQSARTPLLKALHQVPHRPDGKLHGLGNGRGFVSQKGALINTSSERDGNGCRHGGSS
jgi:hypothetical protein